MTDPRRQRSLDAIQRVFFSLVLTRRFHEITIAQVLRESGVARSTFYEIFPNKDALLTSALQGPFSILARCVDAAPDTARIHALLEHFWQNRAMARCLFTGTARPKMVKALAVELDAALVRRGARLTVPRALAATALAELQLGALAAWLLGQAPGDAASLAAGLVQTCRDAFREPVN